MKVFWVLAWSKYYPCGDLGNVNSQWETLEKAEAAAELLRVGEYEHDYIQIRDVSDMLGIERTHHGDH